MPSQLSSAVAADPATAIMLPRAARAFGWLPFLGAVIKLVIALLPLIETLFAAKAAQTGLAGPAMEDQPREMRAMLATAQLEARAGGG